VKPALLSVAILAATCGLSIAQDFDINQPQSPPRPAPAWVRLTDQGRVDPRLQGYFAPEGLKVEIVADFPTVVNPVGMTFGDDGTLYVLEWRPDTAAKDEFPQTFTYKDGSQRTLASAKKSVKDVVKVLRDTQDKGVYDRAEVVLEPEIPSSILIHDGWLYLSGRGKVERYKQSRPGGPYDIRALVGQGFCAFHHHQVSGLTIGNDGWLYITAGDADNFAEGSDGSRVTFLRTGAVFRCRPDGSRLHAYALGFRNPYRDIAFDTAFNLFHLDNDNDDGTKFMGCRLMHVTEASDFGWRLLNGAVCCVPDPTRATAFGEHPGRMPALLKTGRGAPAGLLIYNDTRLPERFRGLLFYPDVFRKLIRAYRVEPRDSTFAVVEEFAFLKTDDPLFRPCQMVLGPDGAIYICDWRTDSGGAGRLFGDGQHGRIYRVSWAGTDNEPALPLRALDSWATIAKRSNEELLQTLSAPDFSDRLRAQRELARRGAKNRGPLLEVLKSNKLDARIAALGALESLWTADVQTAFCDLLADPEPALRRLAADALALNGRPGDSQIHEALLGRFDEQNPAVKRAIYLAMGRVAAPGAADCLVNAFRVEETKDRVLFDGLVRAIERLGKPGIDKLIELAESGVDADRDRVLDAFLGLRTRAAAEAVPYLLQSPHLSTRQRADLLRSYGHYLLDPPVPLAPVLDYLTRHPRDLMPIQLAGLEVLAAALPEQRAPALREPLTKLLAQFFDEDRPELRLAVIRAVEANRLVAFSPRLIATLENRARSVPERTAAVKALRVLNDRSAVAALQEVLAEPAAAAGLREEAFHTLAAIDRAAAFRPARAFLDQPNPFLQKEALLILASQPEGARLIGERFLANKLPRAFLPDVSDALRKHAPTDPAAARLLTEVLKNGLLLSLSKTDVERVERLVRAQGSPERGRALFLDNKTLACTNCHRLETVGNTVGPDLTRIWDTHSIEKIMEAIIDPSKEIKEGFQTFVATTKQGQTYTGLKVEQTKDELVLRDANAKEIRIAARDLEEVVPTRQSLMPANVVSQLSFAQFIDLVAFLKDRQAQEALRASEKEKRN
jgi:putative membrane-bound dehydrogenase-like protein